MMDLKTIILLLSILSIGLMAGIFFTWSNAVSPGIGKLPDSNYLWSFQSMNRVILNPLFIALFIFSVLSLILNATLNFGNSKSYDFKWLLVATIIYIAGAFLLTLMGNIPLNEILNKADLEKLKPLELSQLRENIETKWNNFNLIRSISAFITFCILLLTLVLKK